MNRRRHTVCVFFFQAEDGIRDATVTRVQTCALPICLRVQRRRVQLRLRQEMAEILSDLHPHRPLRPRLVRPLGVHAVLLRAVRSEERRVGKEWRPDTATEHEQEERYTPQGDGELTSE